MAWKGFVEGGVASVVAGSVTHPLDLIKVRMQLHGEGSLQPAWDYGRQTGSLALKSRLGPISAGYRVVQMEGGRALFSGVSASMLRQASYSTTCIGLYNILKEKWQEGQRLPLHKRIAAGLIAGGIGAAVGNPADVAMVRMQADGRLPEGLRRNYHSVVDALRRMVKEEGIGCLWRGSGLTVKRAMLVSSCQLSTYDHVKEELIHYNLMKNGFSLHLVASVSAGIMASMASNPVDVIKTRIMNMKVEEGEVPLYKGPLDCALKTVKREGPLALYKGIIPTMCRQGPFTVVLFVTLEQMRKMLKDY
eukprot:c22140_g1_i1 orf=522-1436(+)